MDRFREERRKHERIAMSLPIRYFCAETDYLYSCLEQKEHLARTLNFCEGGVGIIANEYLSISTNLIVKFIRIRHINSENKEDKYIIFEGKVSHVTPLDNNEFRIGISFGILNEKNREKYFDVLCLSEKQLKFFK